MQRYIEELREVGITIIPDAYTKDQVALYVEKISAIAGPMVGDTQNVWSFFRHDHDLFDLVYHPTLDAILKEVLEADYTLTAADVINRQKVGGASNFANDWHTDSRYLGNDRRLDAGFSYSVVIMLDDFTEENGATRYIPGSHKKRIRPNRQGNCGLHYDTPGECPCYECHKVLTGKAGTMAIFDSGLWHKGGPSSEQRRWGVFNLYSPWFVKPYFDYPKMLGPEFGKGTTKELRRLLHYSSQPPIDDTERTNTLVRE